MIQVGTVKTIILERNSVIVNNDQTKFDSPELIVLMQQSGTGQENGLPKVDSRVCYIMFGHRQGFVIGTPFTKDDTKLTDAKIKQFIRVSDSRYIIYNTDTGLYEVKTERIDLNSADVRLGESPTEPGVLGNQLSSFMDLLKAYLLTGSTSSGPVTFAGTFPDFTASKATQVKLK